MRIIQCSLLLLSIASANVFAAKVLSADRNYWKCAVYDSSEKYWASESSYRLTAINKAMAQCKKQSQFPRTCKAAKENCDAYVDGQSTTAIWQCMALDFQANEYESGLYRQRYDAGLKAKDYCKANSHYPESCYINLIACENLNDRSL